MTGSGVGVEAIVSVGTGALAGSDWLQDIVTMTVTKHNIAATPAPLATLVHLCMTINPYILE